MPNAGVILEDVLNDTLLLGSLAASIFIKNPGHQTQAGNVISAVAQLLQVIDAQINPPVAPTPATPTSAPTSNANAGTAPQIVSSALSS